MSREKRGSDARRDGDDVMVGIGGLLALGGIDLALLGLPMPEPVIAARGANVTPVDLEAALQSAALGFAVASVGIAAGILIMVLGILAISRDRRREREQARPGLESPPGRHAVP